MPEQSGSSRERSEQDASRLRERALLMIAAFEREEPSPTWPRLGAVVERARRSRDLRTIVRECRGLAGGMSPAGRRELERELREQFGPDPDWERDQALVAKVRARGRIRSEREYRVVQAYQDAIAGEAERQDEFLVLGTLLDEFSAAR